MTRKILAVCLILSIAVNIFFTLRWIHYRTKDRRPSYASNDQYSEQTNIFGAYRSDCSIAFIGDSHIYKCHWSELLNTVCCNRGIGSDITEGVYNRVKEVVFSRPKICFIACGSNDIDMKIPADTTVSYMRKIVQELQRAGITPVIMEITPVGENYPNKEFNEKAAVLNGCFRQLCKTIRIELGENDRQPDGIHLTAGGYEKWRVAVADYLKKS